MSSKTTFNQWRVAGNAALAATELSPLTAEALQRFLGPVLEPGEAPPDLGRMQELISQLITDSATRLMELEDRYAQVQLAERSRRDALAEAAVKLRQELVHARALLRQLYGIGKGIAVLGAKVNIGTASPLTLVRMGRQLVDVLRSPSFELPPAPWAVVQRPDPGAMATALEQVLLPAEALLVENQPTHQVTEIGKGARDVERAELKDRVRRCTKFLDGLYQLVGLDYHAERLRASARRRKAPSTEEPGGEQKLAFVADPATSPASAAAPTAGKKRGQRPIHPETAAAASEAANDRGTHAA
jgi:hypothetical protein